MKTQIEINALLKEFYDISGFRVSIHDIEYNELYAYPQNPSPYCARIRESEAARRECLAGDEKAFQIASEKESAYLYQCACGLYQAVAPVYHYGVLSGYLMMGPVRDNSEYSLAYIIGRLKAVIPGEAEPEKYVDAVNPVDERLIHSYIDIMEVIAEYITNSNKLSPRHESVTQLTMKYINRYYAKKITLTQLAEKFGCSSVTLMNSFKKEYGVSVITYLNSVRLENAKRLLKGSRSSVKEISASCGFSNQNYFSRLFMAQCGMSPTKYRQGGE